MIADRMTRGEIQCCCIKICVECKDKKRRLVETYVQWEGRASNERTGRRTGCKTRDEDEKEVVLAAAEEVEAAAKSKFSCLLQRARALSCRRALFSQSVSPTCQQDQDQDQDDDEERTPWACET